MISVCSRTFSAKGSPPWVVASFIMTEIGVLSAWARLPTWVRARVTISRLASMSALVSRASGAISTGNAPSSRSAATRTDGGETLRDALERRETETHLKGRGQQQHDPQHPEGDDEGAVEAARLLVDLVGVAGDGDEIAPLLAEIDGPLDEAQLLAFGAVDVSLAGAPGHPGHAEVGELRQRCIPQRPRRAHVGRRRVQPRHLPIPARERQIEQRLADGLRKLVDVLLGRRHVGDEGAQIDPQPAVERAFHRGAVDRRQHDAGDDENYHGPGRRREEEPKGERIKTHCPAQRGGSQVPARSG